MWRFEDKAFTIFSTNLINSYLLTLALDELFHRALIPFTVRKNLYAKRSCVFLSANLDGTR